MYLHRLIWLKILLLEELNINDFSGEKGMEGIGEANEIINKQ